MMDFAVFDELGERIRAEYARADFDESRLPEIAETILGAADLPELDVAAVGSFLLRTEVKQEPGIRFSDMPVILYRTPEFYMQLLLWNESTTTIHQHAFAGAFRVLAGASLHSEYAFEQERAFGSRLLLGQARLEHIELLERGGVRRIRPGGQGLVHALFHLEQPSATVVVRSYRLPWCMPQYAIRKPHFAYDEFGLQSDERVQTVRAAARAMRESDPAAASRFLIEEVTTLDFPRVFQVSFDIDALLPDEPDRDAFFAAVRRRHGDVANRLRDTLAAARTEASVLLARRHSIDPELRFFLALLLNVPDRDSMDRLVAQRFPGEDPVRRYAGWLARLADPQSMLDALVRKRALSESRRGADTLVTRLARALPGPREEAEQRLSGWLAANGTAGGTELRDLPELAPLFLAR